MTDAARIAALEAALEDVLKRLDPQRLAQSMEFVWQPRGGEPRIIDENGVTLDYVPAIQFLGATTELDVPAQRAVVTATGGGSAAYTFSDDATPTAAQRIAFVGESDATKTRATISTDTTLGVRSVSYALGEDVLTAAGPLTVMQQSSSVGADTGGLSVLAFNAGFTRQAGFNVRVTAGGAELGGSASDSGGGVATTSAVLGASAATTELSVTAKAGDPATATVAATSTDAATVEVVADGSGGAFTDVEATDGVDSAKIRLEAGSGVSTVVASGAGGSLVVINEAAESDLMRATDPSTAGPVRRVMTGPLAAVSGVLAPGASAFVNINPAGNANVGTAALLGGLLSAAGAPGDTEWVAWSWTETGAGTVTVYFTNTDLLGSHEAKFVGYCSAIA